MNLRVLWRGTHRHFCRCGLGTHPYVNWRLIGYWFVAAPWCRWDSQDGQEPPETPISPHPGSVGQPPNSGATGGPGCQCRGARAARTPSPSSVPVRGFDTCTASPGSRPGRPQPLPPALQPGRTGRFIFSRDNHPLFFFPPHLPFGCWKLLLVLGLFLLAQDRGPAGPRLPCSGHGCAARGASPNSHPPPCGPAAVPAASGSAGAVPCVPKRGVPRQWGPWWGERGQCSPRLLWGGFRIPPSLTTCPRFPAPGSRGRASGAGSVMLRWEHSGISPGSPRILPGSWPWQSPGAGVASAPFGATGSCDWVSVRGFFFKWFFLLLSPSYIYR